MAREDLALANASIEGVSYGPLCYHAGQAAEKSIKAILIARSIQFPYVHDIGRLLQLLREAGIDVPESAADADLLTDYATMARYPGVGEIEKRDYETAVSTARAVVALAATIIE